MDIKVTAVVFDYYGTLADFSFSARERLFDDLHHAPAPREHTRWEKVGKTAQALPTAVAPGGEVPLA